MLIYPSRFLCKRMHFVWSIWMSRRMVVLIRELRQLFWRTGNKFRLGIFSLRLQWESRRKCLAGNWKYRTGDWKRLKEVIWGSFTLEMRVEAMGLNETGERGRRGRHRGCLVGCSKINIIAELKIPSYLPTPPPTHLSFTAAFPAHLHQSSSFRHVP